MSNVRRFELVSEQSCKFWQLATDAETMTVCFGRIGSDGQTKVKTFASQDAMTKAVEALVWEKIAKGYREVETTIAANSDLALAPAANPEAKAAVAPAPFGGTRYRLARGDEHVEYLLTRGCVAIDGEEMLFSSEERARDHVERCMAIDRKRGWVEVSVEQVPAETAPLAVEVDASHALRHGGTWTVTFAGEPVPAQRVESAADELTRMAPRAVHVQCEFEGPGVAWERAMRKRSLPSVEAFVFDTSHDTLTRQMENSIGDIAATLLAMPNLERAWLTGNLSFSTCRHEALRVLVLLADPLAPELLHGLGACAFPSLEHLVLHLCTDAGDPSPSHIAAALEHVRAPALGRVEVMNASDVPALIDALAMCHSLPFRDLAVHGTVADEDSLVATVERHRVWLGHFDKIALPYGGDHLSEEAEARIASLVPGLRDTYDDRYGGTLAGYQEWLE